MTPDEPNYSLRLPGIDDEVTAWEAERKGYFDAVVVVGQHEFPVTFYAVFRLASDADLAWGFGWSGLPLARVIVVPSVTKQSMISAVADIEERDPGLVEFLGAGE